MSNEIGLAIRLARVAVGKSQWQIAVRVGIHPSTLNLIENGKRIPDASLAQSVLREINTGAPTSPLTSLVLGEAEKIANIL